MWGGAVGAASRRNVKTRFAFEPARLQQNKL